MVEKIWANSGDSHGLEPDELFWQRMPGHLAERMPRSVKDPDGRHETVYVDGQEFRRRLPAVARGDGDDVGLTPQEANAKRAPGAMDAELRLKDLDQQGI